MVKIKKIIEDKVTFIPLLDLEMGSEAIISCINCGYQCTQRLLDMGLTKGTEVKMLRKAPLNGPIEINVRGTNLVIGRGMASKIYVDVKEKRR